MSWRGLFDDEVFRLRAVLVVMLGALGVLGVVLWRMQVANAVLYQHSLSEQSVRRLRLPGQRGQIFARDGTLLAGNQPSYNLVLYLEELRRPGRRQNTVTNVEAVVQKLAQILGEPPRLKRSDILAHIHQRLPLPLTAWRNLTPAARARFAEQTLGWRGVAVEVEPARVYPEGALAAHVLGYVRRAEPEVEEEAAFNYADPEMTGHAGVEKYFDALLRGTAGEKILAVDVSGFNYRFQLPGLAGKLQQRAPVSGHDVVLTLDARVQRLAENALEGVSGAAVVLDPNTGDVLAMASRPHFDPNDLTGVISRETWQLLLNDPGKPLLNRALSGAYPPGSIFKPVVAMAALDLGQADPAAMYSCPGYFMIGKHRMECWDNRVGHGPLNLRGALTHSCDVYFYNLGLRYGGEVIHDMATALGLGRRTGVELEGEVAGLVPNEAWKRRVWHDGWRDGDSCNFSIGQGALLVTPLQMASVTATLANGGKVWRPRLFLGLREAAGALPRPPPKLAHTMAWNAAHLRLVREGMRDVINAPAGTGKHAALPDVMIAGKTGTAEIGKKGEGHKLAWMIAFAPYEAPRYAIVVLVEEGVSGGATVAPLIHNIMNGLFHPDTGEGEG
ncbi:MAG: penicillin-binding protein 2 [Verrucomicrobia bacterium]|nr:MAG: penicillin-binding protein 2 [Verrucomicrobiota bacterium]